ncbi:MAG: zinc-dependent metalloprotease family protein [Sedimentitalea sp.]
MSEVSDYTALLYYTEYSYLRWNAAADVGTQMVVTYSFTETEDLSTNLTHSASSYWSYDQSQRDQMRDVFDQYEAIAGMKFVEVQGTSMINIFGATGADAGGWANISQSGTSITDHNQGIFVNAYQTMTEGSYGHQVNLHELGHAMGLKHPHDGDTTLEDEHDTQGNTVMTYNIEYPYVTTLGPLDIAALSHIYGGADSFDGWDVSVNGQDRVTIKGTDDAETIIATDQNTRVFGKGGDDIIEGAQGDDTLNGGADNDTITGGLGGDTLVGLGGNDILIGDTSTNDYASGGANSDDRLFGNKGNDTAYGGNGDDVIRGGGGRDTLMGQDGADTLTGNGGSDVFLFTTLDAYETDTITDFQQGRDMIDVSDMSYMQMNSLTITQDGADTTLSYSNWFEIDLTGFSGTLDSSDFIFA